MPEIAIGVMTSVKIIQRFTACKETWLKDFNYKYLFGGYLKHPDLISLGDHVGEDNNSAFLKQYLGLKYMYEQTQNIDQVQWYFFVGCDTFIYKERLEEIATRFDPTKEWYITGITNTGMLARYYKNPTNYRVAFGGAGFLLSKPVLKKLYPHIDSFISKWPELFKKDFQEMGIECCDVSLAYQLQHELNIPLTLLEGKDDGFYGIQLSNYKKVVEQPVVLHRIYPDEMYELYKRKTK
jgi:hypothetical protein